METWQKITVIIFLVFSLLSLIKGYIGSIKNKNSYGKANIFSILGAFVWGDALVFGFFWFLVSITILLINNWLLFLLTFSVFWVVRGIGETIYWFNQQFTSLPKNSPQSLKLFKYFKSNSVWFIYQIIWQCITVISIITSIYLIKVWLQMR